MPQTIKDADGNDVEVFSAAELAEQVEAKAKEAADAAVAEEAERLNTEHESALLEKEEALADAQEKLKKAEEKELNFKALREKTDKSDKEKSAEEVKNAEELKKLQETVAEIQKQPFETAKAEFIKNNIGADKELAEKQEFYFKKLSVGAKTMDEYNTALEGAFSLATGGTRQPSRDGNMMRTGISDNFDGGGSKAESQDSQNFGALLGLKPEDKKTYAPTASGTVPLFAQTPPKEKV